MRFTRRVVLVAAAAILMIPADLLAGGGGGGGTKRSSSLTVTNETSLPVGVTTNGSSSAIQAAIAAGSSSQFTAAGGTILNPGASHTFSLQAGTYTVTAVDFSTSTPSNVTASEITQSVTLSRGEPVRLYIKATGAAEGGATIEFSFAR